MISFNIKIRHWVRSRSYWRWSELMPYFDIETISIAHWVITEESTGSNGYHKFTCSCKPSYLTILVKVIIIIINNYRPFTCGKYTTSAKQGPLTILLTSKPNILKYLWIVLDISFTCILMCGKSLRNCRYTTSLVITSTLVWKNFSPECWDITNTSFSFDSCKWNEIYIRRFMSLFVKVWSQLDTQCFILLTSFVFKILIFFK